MTAAALADARARGRDDRARPNELSRHRSEAAALVDSLSDDELARRLDAAAWLAGAELYLDRYAEADAHASRALAIARATGQGELFLVLSRSWAGWYGARQAGRGGRAARRRHRSGAPAGQHAGARRGTCSTAPSSRSRSATWSLRSPPHRRASTSAATSTKASTRPGRPSGSPLPCSKPGNRNLPSSCSSTRAGGEELALIPGSWRAHCLELLTRCRLALDRTAEARARSCAREGLGLGRAAATGRRLGRPSGGGRRARMPATPSVQPSGRSHRPLPPMRPGRRSRQRCRARLRAARSAKAGERDRAVAELQRAAARARGVRRAALPRRGRTRAAESSATASTGAPGRARPAEPASSR